MNITVTLHKSHRYSWKYSNSTSSSFYVIGFNFLHAKNYTVTIEKKPDGKKKTNSRYEKNLRIHFMFEIYILDGQTETILSTNNKRGKKIHSWCPSDYNRTSAGLVSKLRRRNSKSAACEPTNHLCGKFPPYFSYESEIFSARNVRNETHVRIFRPAVCEISGDAVLL